MVKPGYKQTDVGVIPEEWETGFFDQLGKVVSGGTPSTAVPAFWNGNFAWCTPSDITVNDNVFISTTSRYITDSGLKNSAATLLPKGSLLLCTRATIGFAKINNVPMATNQGFKNLIPNEKTDVRYVHYLIQTLKRKMLEKAIGSTFLEISKTALCSIPIPVPSFYEQKKISTALSDIDELINSLEKLIIKKKSIKQGAMQELLTGKKRLPGFNGEWTYDTLNNIKKGSLITSKELKPGNVPVIAGGKTPAYYHNQHNIDEKCVTVSASGASAGYVWYHNEPIFASDCCVIKSSNRYSAEFIYQALALKQNEIYSLQTGGAQPHIYPQQLESIKINFPPINEQKAIASVLSDMDSEIDALEQKLQKAQQLKQGMMQQLLTGKIRLV